MFEQKKNRQDYYMKKEILSDIGENPSGEDVLDYFLGDQDGNYSDYTIYKYQYGRRSLIKRLNMLWFYPVFLLSIPFQWLITGKTGISRNGKIGLIVDKLVGFD